MSFISGGLVGSVSKRFRHAFSSGVSSKIRLLWFPLIKDLASTTNYAISKMQITVIRTTNQVVEF